MKQRLIAIVGPTATGKSDVAVAVAAALDGEVISADSVQVYRGLDIGSAKISVEERRGIPHHLLDIVGPETEYNIARFQKDATAAIDAIGERGKLPIVCGGSGLYIDSLLYEGFSLGNSEEGDPKRREAWRRLAEERGAAHLHALLKEKFPRRAEKIHPNDVKRVIRGLEMTEDLPEENFSHVSPFALSLYGLTIDRAVLYRRVEERVEAMFEQGLVKEVAALLDAGYPKDGNAMQALGYKEILPLLAGEYDEATAKELLKRNTRRFAKRQWTWFRRDPNIRWLDTTTTQQKKDAINTILTLEKSFSTW